MYICHLFDSGVPQERNKVRYLIALYDLATLPLEWQGNRPIPFRFHFVACNGQTRESVFYKADMLARVTNSLEPISRMESRVLAVQAEQERLARGGEPYHHDQPRATPETSMEAEAKVHREVTGQ